MTGAEIGPPPPSSSPQGPLWHLASAGVYGGLLVPAVVIPDLYNQYTFAKAIFLQVVVALTCPAYVVLALRHPQLRPRRSMVTVAAAAWMGVAILTTLVAEDRTRAFFGSADRMMGLFALLHLFVWALMVLGTTTTMERWLSLLRVHTVLGALLAVVGLVQLAVPTFFVFGGVVEGGRVIGLAGNPIYFASHQLLVFFIAALLWRRVDGQRGSSAYLLVMVLSFLAVLASGSRGPLLGLGLGAAAAVVVVVVARGAPRVGVGIAGAIALGAVAWLSLAGIVAPHVSQPGLRHLLDLSEPGRVGYWTIAARAIGLHPILGVGLDSFDLAYVLAYVPVNACTPFHEDQAHNIVLQTLATTGVVGLCAWLLLWASLFAAVVRSSPSVGVRAALMGLLVGHLTQSQLAFDTPSTWSSLLLVGAFIAFGAAAHAGPSTGRPSSSKMALGVGAMLQLLAVGGGFSLTLRPALASRSFEDIAVAHARRDDTLAVQRVLASASSTWPYDEEWLISSAELLRQLADERAFSRVPDPSGLIDTVVTRGAEILKRQATEARLGPLYGRMLSDVGEATQNDRRRTAAEEQLRRNLAFNPRRTNTMMDLADHLAATHRVQEATQLFERALAENPGHGESERRAGVFFWRSGNDRPRGADLLIHATTCPCLDAATPRRIAQLAEAHAFRGGEENQAALREIAGQAARFGRIDQRWTLAVARVLERRDLVAERNLVLRALLKSDPKQQRYQAVVDGKLARMAEAEPPPSP